MKSSLKARMARMKEGRERYLKKLKILKANKDTNQSNNMISESAKTTYYNTIIESSVSVNELVKNEPEEPIAEHINPSNYWDLEDDVDETEDKLDSQNNTRSSNRIAKKKLRKAKPEEECTVIGFIAKKRKYNRRKKLLSSSTSSKLPTQNDIWRRNSVRISDNLMKLKKQSRRALVRPNIKKKAHKRSRTSSFVSKAKISSNYQEMEGTGYFTDAVYEEVNTKCGNCSYVFVNESEKSKTFEYCHQSGEISNVQLLDGIFSIYGLTANDWTRALLPNCEFTEDCHTFFDGVSFCNKCVSCLQSVYESHQILKSVSDQHSVFAKTISFKSGYPFKSDVEEDSSLDMSYEYHVDNNAPSPFEEYQDFDCEDNDVKYDPLDDSFEVKTDTDNISIEVSGESTGKNVRKLDGSLPVRGTAKIDSSCPVPINKELQIKTKSVHTSFGPISCCGILISEQKAFLIHKAKQHSDNSELWEAQCTLCDDLIVVDNIEDHVMANQRFPAVKIYKCDICGFTTYTDKCRFISHQRAHDTPEEDVGSENYLLKKLSIKKNFEESTIREMYTTTICEYCEKDLNTEAALITHLAGHDPLKYQATCDECGIVVKSSIRLKAHKWKWHRKLEDCDWRCEICNKGFKCQSHLKAHTKIHLLPKKSLVCKKCGKKFSNMKDLTPHLQKHEDVESSQEFKCPECGKKLKHRFSLRKHINDQHKSKRLFMCDQCGKTTKNQTNMRIHMQVHDSTRNVKKEYQYKPKQAKSKNKYLTENEIENAIALESSATQSVSNIIE